jgi:hypothetical protein
MQSRDDLETGEESEPQFDQDPEPGQRPRSRRARKTAAPPARKATASVTKMAKEVSADLASLIEMSAAVWGMTDECCAPILERQAKPIADAFTSILSRNPRLLAKFANTDLVAYSIQAGLLFKALKPVATAVYHNHVSKTDEDEGEATNGGVVHLGNFPAFSGIAR